jgi:hypothetical protein
LTSLAIFLTPEKQQEQHVHVYSRGLHAAKP